MPSKKALVVSGLCAAGAAVGVWTLMNGGTKTSTSGNSAPEVNTKSGASTTGSCRQAASPTSTGSPASPAEPVLLVLYASATGTAEQFAKGFSREARAKGFVPVCMDVADVDCDKWLTNVNAKAVVMFVATAGDGDPPDGFLELHKKLTSSSKGDIEKIEDGLPFAVFGLGDTSYVHYNMSGKETDKALEKLGGKRLVPLGLGNAKEDMELALDDWKELLWEPLADQFGISLESGDIQPELHFSYLPADTKPAELVYPKPPSQLEPTQANPLHVPVVVKHELLSAEAVERDQRSTLHIELDITGTCITYQSGDHLGLFAANDDEVVEKYLAKLDLHDKTLPLLDAEGDIKNMTVELCSTVRQRARASLMNTLPARVSLFQALKWYCDLQGKPKKSTIRALVRYCTDDEEAEKLRKLLSREGAAEYHEMVGKARTIFGVLERFPSCKPPIGHFLEVMPRIAPRYYSISSDQLVHKTKIHLTLGVVEDGLVSQFFKRSSIDDCGQQFMVPIYVRKSTFHLPLRAKQRPLLLIGPGTGLAPLRGFCYRRQAWKAKKAELGECHLYFGCRRSTHDYIYKDELEKFEEDGILTQVVTAFSREGPNKVYVQHKLRENADSILKLIKAGGAIYICGDASGMAVDVEEVLAEVLASEAGGFKNVESAKEELERMTKMGKYIKDVW